MSGREMRATLRGATAAGVLEGWYAYGFGAMRRYVVNPPDAPTQTYDIAGAGRYCRMLRESGVKPVYRESEPSAL